MQFDNYVVPKQVTTYACQAFTFPTDAERHIIALRPKDPTAYNHHAILHVCANNDYFSDHASPQVSAASRLPIAPSIAPSRLPSPSLTFHPLTTPRRSSAPTTRPTTATPPAARAPRLWAPRAPDALA